MSEAEQSGVGENHPVAVLGPGKHYSTYPMIANSAIRRAGIGFLSGLISSVSLAATLHSFSIGIAWGLVVGIMYALVVRPVRFSYAESVFTAASLSVALWALVSLILLPLFTGQPPQWTAEGMRRLFPQLVGWVLYGASLGLLAQLFSDLSERLFGPGLPSKKPVIKATRIVILGGGFAGMTTAESLEQAFGADRSVIITLISEGNALLFTPMLAEVAGSSLEPSHISSPLRTSLRRTAFMRAQVTGVDFENRRVLVASISGETEAILYDQLVFALGSVSNYFGNENIRKNSFDFKSLLDAIHIRSHVIDMFEQADREANADARRKLLTFVIAGGGFAGVELAGALNDFARGILADYPRLQPHDVNVTLVHSRPTILPELSEQLGAYALRHMQARGVHFLLGARVVDASPGFVMLDKQQIEAATLIWTAGTAPNPLLREAGLAVDKRGAALVETTLAIRSHAGVWALGDCAAVVDAKTGKACPPTAQFALREAQVLGRNIKASIQGKPLKPFHFDSLGALCVVGHHTACAELKTPWPLKTSVRFSGLLAWLMWRGIYLSKLPGIERKVRVLIDWTIELFFPRDIIQTIDLSK